MRDIIIYLHTQERQNLLTLSKRLQAICDMVTPGARICDVGCDHAYADIRLLQEGKIPHALAMDVADGPLASARSNLELTELTERCDIRKSDGLAAYQAGEADCMICAGMGGILMRTLLEAEPEKALSFRELILSPQSEIYLVREWLFANGCRISDESFFEDEGKYYTVMKVLCPDGLRPEQDMTSAKPAKEADSMQERPDWQALAERIEGLSEEDLKQAMVSGKELCRILRDPGFHRLTEERYGPCILHRFLEEGKEPCFQEYLTQTLRSRLKVAEGVSQAAAGANGEEGSSNARQRLSELWGEIGILQTLFAVRQLNQRKEGV